MDFKNYLQTSAVEINQELDQFFDGWSREVLKTSPKILHLNKHFIDACKGGKRLRGALLKLGYELAGDKHTLEIIKPAVAFEIFQTAVLAQDDIVDLSPTRRGKPTLYKILGGDHYSISQTMILGDIGFFLGMRLILDSDFEEKRKVAGAKVFTEMVLSTALGEMLDVELPHLGGEIKTQDVLTIHRLKTAFYTIIYPLSLGAVLAGGDKKLLENIRKFGEGLGIAFQIQDDILGVFGDEKTLGKSVTSDIEEGKNTLLIINALKNASVSQKKILNKYYGKGKIGESELEQIKQVFIDTGALEYSQKYAQKLVAEAKKIIPLLTTHYNLRTILEEMADFLVRRDK